MLIAQKVLFAFCLSVPRSQSNLKRLQARSPEGIWPVCARPESHYLGLSISGVRGTLAVTGATELVLIFTVAMIRSSLSNSTK